MIVRLIHFLKLQNIDNKVFSLLQRSRKKPYTTYRDWVETTLQAKLSVHHEPQSNTINPPRLFVVTPTPPTNSAVAAYSMALAMSLQNSFQVVLVSESKPEAHHLFNWVSPADFLSQWRPEDKVLYHFDDNPLHNFQEELLMKIPGVVDLHEVNLRNYQVQKYRNIEAEEIIEQLIHQKALPITDLKIVSVTDLPDLNGRIVSLGSHLIVHNEAAKVRILASNPLVSEGDVSVISLASKNSLNSRTSGSFPDELLSSTTEGELLGTLEHVAVNSTESMDAPLPTSDLTIEGSGFDSKLRQYVEVINKSPQFTNISVLERETQNLKRIFVDVTSTAVGDSKTGIPRVVKKIVGEWLKNMDVTSVEFVPVYFSPSGSKFYSAERFRASILGWSLQPFSTFEVVPKLGDVYLGLDLQVSDQVQGELFKWKAVGANVYFVLYDLLPVTNPSFFPDDVLEGFKKWALMTAEFDGVFAISQTALQDYLQNIAPTRRNLRTGVFRLGSDFTTHPKDHLSKKAGPSSRNPIEFLMVGTLEPRKGHQEVLEGFHKLWNEGFKGRLTIVGRWGWKVDNLRATIAKSPFKGELLRVINDANDVDLANLYRDSDCLIAASYNEGFGLPLVEAAQMGLPVFARDIPIFREVGGDSLDYFDSITDFSQQLADWSRSYKFDKQLTGKKLEAKSWKQSADALLTLIYPESDFQKSP